MPADLSIFSLIALPRSGMALVCGECRKASEARTSAGDQKDYVVEKWRYSGPTLTQLVHLADLHTTREH